MVVTEVTSGHFFVGEPGKGNLEVLVHDRMAYLYSLEGEFGQGAFLIYPAVEAMLREMGIEEVYLHTDPKSEMNEQLSKIYEKRYGFQPVHVVRMKRLDGDN